MAFLVICLSDNGRAKLYNSILVLSVLSGCVSGLYLAAVVYALVKHSVLLHHLIISLFDDMFFSLIFLGIFLLLLPLVSWKLNRNVSIQVTNHSVRRTHLVWTVFLTMSLVSCAVCASMMTSVQRRVEAELGPRYKHGVARYMDDLSWQASIDRIQDRLQCCGADGHTDWYSSTWIPLNLLPRSADPSLYSKLVQPNGRVLVPLVPSSCCRTSSIDCGHRAWLENKDRSWADVKAADPQLLYTSGCVGAISLIIATDIFILKALLFIIFLMEICLMFGSRYFYSSTLNSLILGRPKGKAPGWLLGPDLHIGLFKQITLEEYDKSCGGRDLLMVDDITKQRKIWKCIDKIRGKSDKDPDSNRTPSSKTKRKLLRSPCISKLKQRYKKTPKQEVITRQKQPSKDMPNVNYELELTGDSDVKGVTSKEIIEHNGEHKESVRIERKISKNVVDFEDNPIHWNENAAKTKVFEVGTRQRNPFINTGNMKFRKSVQLVIPDKNKSIKMNETAKQNEMRTLNDSVADSPSEQDFQKKRILFENISKEEESYESNVRVKPVNYLRARYPVNLIDFSDSHSNKQNIIIQKASSDVSSPGSEHVCPPVTLRNYKLPVKL